MQKYKSSLTDTNGRAISGASVWVIDESSGCYATLYSDRNGAVPLANPLITGIDGTFSFYAANGRYSLRSIVHGATFTENDVVLLLDPNEMGGLMNAVDRSKLDHLVSVLDFGASPSASGTTNRSAIQAALNAAAGKASVYIPAGLYFVDGTIRIPSEIHFYGDGASSVIKMAPTVPRVYPLVQTGTRNGKVSKIIVERMTLDFNSARWTVTGGSYEYDEDGITPLDVSHTTLAICYTEYGIFRNLRVLDGQKHCIDVLAPKYKTSANAMAYDHQPSRFITISDCYVSGGGDDNVTTHHSSDIWITRVISESPSGVRVPGNSNCFEIDDGSRNIFITDCFSALGVCGLQIKGHNNAPAPYNIQVNGFKAVNCMYGLEIRHTKYYGPGLDEAPDPSEPEEGGGSVGTGSGNSYTARNITLNNVEVIAPHSYTNRTGTYTGQAQYGVRIRSYVNVQISNLSVSDGSNDLAGDYLPATPLAGYLGAAVRIYSGARKILINNIKLYGFNTNDSGILFTGSMGDGFVINGLTSVNGPKHVVRASGSNPVVNGIVENYMVSGDWPENTPMYIRSPNIRIGQGCATGYRNAVNTASQPTRVINKLAVSSGNNPTSLVPVDVFGWQEGDTQDLGAGEGLKQSWTVNLVNDVAPTEVGYIGFSKSSSSDSDRSSEFVVAVSPDGVADPTRRIVVKPAAGIALFDSIDSTNAPNIKMQINAVASLYGNATHLGFYSNSTSGFILRQSIANGSLAVFGDLLEVNGGFRSDGVYSGTTANAANVVVAASGYLYRSTSSLKYKRDVEDVDPELMQRVIDGVRPIWYRSTCEIDRPDFGWWGIAAEELAQIDPRLVNWQHPLTEQIEQEATPEIRDEHGNITQAAMSEIRAMRPDTSQPAQPEGVMYERLVVPLLWHAQQMQSRMSELERRLAALEGGT